MSNQSIYLQLTKAGLTPEGACGLMGNMMAESTMKSNIAQRGMTSLTDEAYTTSFNSNPAIHIRDSVGYGLCQWTFWSRKQGLSDYARSRGKSVGDETTQVEFCLKELKEQYPRVFNFLTTTTSIYDAASKVCIEYEQPAVNNIQDRANYGKQFYNQFKNLSTSNNSDQQNQIINNQVQVKNEFWPPRMICYGMKGDDVEAMQGLLRARGYPVTTDGRFNQNTKDCLIDFQEAVGLVPDGVAGPLTWSVLLDRKK